MNDEIDNELRLHARVDVLRLTLGDALALLPADALLQLQKRLDDRLANPQAPSERWNAERPNARFPVSEEPAGYKAAWLQELGDRMEEVKRRAS